MFYLNERGLKRPKTHHLHIIWLPIWTHHKSYLVTVYRPSPSTVLTFCTQSLPSEDCQSHRPQRRRSSVWGLHHSAGLWPLTNPWRKNKTLSRWCQVARRSRSTHVCRHWIRFWAVWWPTSWPAHPILATSSYNCSRWNLPIYNSCGKKYCFLGLFHAYLFSPLPCPNMLAEV
jgi:hypothetical protein